MTLYLAPSVRRMSISILVITWLWHATSCSFWAVAIHEGLGTSTWTPDAEWEHHSDHLNYALCLRRTMETLWSITCINEPETYNEALFTIFMFILGIFMNAVIIGSVSATINNLDAAESQRRELLDRVIRSVSVAGTPLSIRPLPIIHDAHPKAVTKPTSPSPAQNP